MGRDTLKETPGSKGARNELVAASALMGRGYAVYFPVDRSGYVDLLAIKGTRVHRVQVKSAHFYGGELVVRTRATGYPPGSVTLLVVVWKSFVWAIPWSVVGGRQTLRVSRTELDKKWRIT